jgi:LDH2 family malate/lactate/ureidoglycolate dehydrogenase
MIDLMCGLLSGGASGPNVKPLYGDASVPYDCSQLFIAVDVSRFCDISTFRAEAAAAAERIRSARRGPGVTRLFAPGEPEWLARQNADDQVKLEPAVIAKLIEVAGDLRVSAEPLASLWSSSAGMEQHAKT